MHENEFLRVFKQRLIDMDMQALSMEIRGIDRSRTYKILKARFGTYLIFKIGYYVHIYTKLRGGLHVLKLEVMWRSHQARSVTSATIDQSQLIVTLF